MTSEELSALGTGHKEDALDVRDRPASMLLNQEPASASEQMQSRASLEGLLTYKDILSQGSTNSCVGQSVCQAIRLHWRIEGHSDAPLPNVLASYWWSRKGHQATDRDEGTYPRLAFDGLREYGFCRDDVWPFETDRVLTAPPPKVYRASFDQLRQLAYFRIDSSPAQRRAQIKQAIDQLRVGTVAIRVNAAFQRVGRNEVWDYSGPPIGSHNVVFLGYSDEGVRIANSWGADWGDDGLGWVGWKTILDSTLCVDPYVITMAPRISGLQPPSVPSFLSSMLIKTTDGWANIDPWDDSFLRDHLAPAVADGIIRQMDVDELINESRVTHERIARGHCPDCDAPGARIELDGRQSGRSRMPGEWHTVTCAACRQVTSYKLRSVTGATA